MRISRWSGVLAVAAVLVAGCAAGAGEHAAPPALPGYLAVADRTAEPGGALELQMPVDIGTAVGLDPQLTDVATSWQLMSLVYETLVTMGPGFRIDPGLATHWENPEPTRYVFHLREGVTFSNGRLMTAADVVGSMRRLLSGRGVWRVQLGPVESVSELDQRTVEFRLSRPYTPFLAALANVPAAVLPMAEIDSGALDPARTMLGTGPFVVEAHRQHVFWRFKRREGYWMPGRPVVDMVTISIVPQEHARMSALESGAADMVVLGDVAAPQVLGDERNIAVHAQGNTDFYYLMLNTLAPGSKFADQRIRTAIAIALDRSRIAAVATGGLGRPTGATPVDLPGACDPAHLPSATAGLERARQLLREAGAVDLSFTLTVFATEPAPAVARVVQQNLARIGVRVTVEELDEASWADKVYGQAPARFDAALSWFAGYADAGMVPQWWNPAAAGFNGGFMRPNPALDRAIEAANTRPDGAERTAALRDLCIAVDADAQMIPLVTRPVVIGYRTDTVSPSLYATEGYGNPYRAIAEFRALSK
ncbi:ABC transporter substrate-binding protein [Saccharopolyspora subtropica]|uniref:ABC transporter substrate-binding protein n=1 Tax=Saccharopolyspora thermophila TaxID=89367 RepID=A0A917JSG7_9PSEU|nr:ABC transporter substrate-binding protein [Saccharopolyspora subtropica]GGI84147.1 ABC transporter substrate-binding protein [Saccharopolyspora subtropica]